MNVIASYDDQTEDITYTTDKTSDQIIIGIEEYGNATCILSGLDNGTYFYHLKKYYPAAYDDPSVVHFEMTSIDAEPYSDLLRISGSEVTRTKEEYNNNSRVFQFCISGHYDNTYYSNVPYEDVAAAWDNGYILLPVHEDNNNNIWHYPSQFSYDENDSSFSFVYNVFDTTANRMAIFSLTLNSDDSVTYTFMDEYVLTEVD